MKLNFKFKIKDLEGNELPNSEANKLLSNVISSLNKGNSIKLYDWAMTLYKGIDLEIDKSDTEVLRALVEQSESITILAKAPILKYIDKILNEG